MSVAAAENPFRVSRMHGLPFFDARLDWEKLIEQFKGLGYRAAIVGAHGHGKSTMLGEFAGHLEDKGFRTHRFFMNNELRVPIAQGESALTEKFSKADIVLLDGAEQLGALAWRRFLWQVRGARGLVITTHAPGRLPPLYTCETSRETLDALLAQLVPGCDDALREEAHSLYAQHGGNVREVFFGLYEAYGR